jgi:hypothetical protein
MGEGFVELEPFEHERHASGSRFNLKLELRIWNWSWLASRITVYIYSYTSQKFVELILKIIGVH